MRYSRLFPAMFCALAIIVCTSAASAQRSVPGIEIHLGKWAFIPTLYDGDVETVVGLRTDSPDGDNITAMWFIKESNGTWTSYGWSEQDQSKTIGYVKAALQIPDDDDRNWRVAPTAVNPDDLPPQAMVRGVFANDPFADTIASAADPDAVLNVLVIMGWSAARNPVIGECQISTWLNAIVTGVERELVQPEDDFAELNAVGQSCQGPAPAAPCTEQTIIGGVTSSGCVDTTGWVFAPPTTIGVTMGQCYPNNCWNGSFFKYERRRVRKIYANCTTCTMYQTRTMDCTASVCELDTSTPLGTPPCPAFLPFGYTPPAGPSIGSPCTVANPSCGGWSDWDPPIEDICP